jgi:hypothetical protein
MKGILFSFAFTLGNIFYMEDFERKERDEIYSRPIRAGKRTYFFDVKEMKSGEMYITITESKKRFNEENGRFFYEKHKIFLYKEDFDKFANGLDVVVNFIRTGETAPEEEYHEFADQQEVSSSLSQEHSDL